MGVTDTASSKALGLIELLAIGIGGMIGGGIFSVLGLAVGIAGNAAPLAFALGGAVAMFAGYSYVRLALRYRTEGASFTYLDYAFPDSPWIAAVTGWTVIVGYIGTLALYAFTFGAYGADLLGWPGSVALRHGLSVLVLVAFMYVNLRGARMSGLTEDAFVYGKLILLAGLALAGLGAVEPDRFRPWPDRGWLAPLMAGALVFVAFEGFQLITNAVLEARDPERNLPRAIYGSVLAVSLVYVLLAVVAVGALDQHTLVKAREYALAVAARPVLGDAGPVLVDLAAMMATASAINATMFGAARMMADMARNHEMPRPFSFRNRVRVPWAAVATMTALALVFTLLGGLGLIASFSSLTFLIVCFSVSVAHWRLVGRTGGRRPVILTGWLLMLGSIAMLLEHLARNDPETLLWIAAIYGFVALAEAGYRTLGRD